MSILATSSSSQRELIPSGNYIARCISMIEIGTVPESFQGETKLQKKVRITWELPLETKIFNPEKGEQPLIISKEYTLSMHEKSTLRKDLKSWRGKDFTEEEARSFDITRLLSAPCMLAIIHHQSKSDPSKVYENIAAITSIPKGVTAPQQVNPSTLLAYDKFNQETFDKLPDFLKSKMKLSVEYQAMKPELLNGHTEDNLNDDDGLPF